MSMQDYYLNTQDSMPHPNIVNFIKFEKNVGNAIDLGCGSGRDTVFLIKNNWNVLSIDKENTKEMITKRLSKEDLKKFRFSNQNFENIELEKNDLVVANYSLPFCSKNYFYQFWNKVVNSISENRLFRRKFIWTKRFMGKYKKANGIPF